ncbi:MAG: InlB B-repeat-containing protein, partial [Treponema sp.]|nr:InlB B-repeat-containing protein [Treponema sp.]
MIGKGRKILKPLLSLFLVSFFIFTSCIIDCDEPDTSFQSIENSTSSSSSISSSSELPVSNEAIPQKAILKIGFADDNSARTVLPKVQLSNYVLKGSLAGGASVVLATADTKEEMKTKEIELDPGVWSFTLSADMTGTSVLSSVKSYSDTQDVMLTGNPVTVNFDLKPRDSNGTEITKGAVSISLTLSSDVISANKAMAILKLGGGKKASKEDDVSAGGTFTFTAENLDKDTYDLEIEFYSKDGDSGTIIPQNTWQALVRIEPGLLSSAEVTGFNLNEVYNITYENVGDAVPDPEVASGIAIKSFSRKSALELPKYTKSGSSFAGWYDNAAFEGSSITEFNPANASSDVTFYAKWVSTTIYVKQGATGSGDSLDNAVGNFSAAFDVMKEFKTLSGTANDFIIKVCGQVDGNQSLPTGLTDAIATSVTIEGNTGLDAAGVPENSLYGKETGTVLTISTTVPVIIQNLKIYGGSGSKGGGIYMLAETHVTLDSGALIGDEKQEVATSSDYGNKASSGGGGIYNAGGNLVLNSGSKVCHNYDGNADYSGGEGGGGIKCSGGSIAIDGAVISYNKTTTRGGGINIAKGSSSSSLTMYSGEISHNDTTGWGGGVMLHTEDTSFEMYGGKISYNLQSDTSRPDMGPNGAAIFMDGGSFTMRNDAEISYNEAKYEHGGIVFVGETCKVYLYGGLIKNNKAARGNGSAVAMGGKPTVFEMSGSIYIPYDSDNNQNDVEISNGKVIKITGELDTSVSKPIATLHPGSYARGRTIFEAASPVTDLSAYQDYFAFKVAGWKTKLSDDKTKLMLDSPIYVKAGGSSTATGTKTNPFDTIEHACSLLS